MGRKPILTLSTSSRRTILTSLSEATQTKNHSSNSCQPFPPKRKCPTKISSNYNSSIHFLQRDKTVDKHSTLRRLMAGHQLWRHQTFRLGTPNTCRTNTETHQILLPRTTETSAFRKNAPDRCHPPNNELLVHQGLVCKNWWYNPIGVPRTLGPAFLLFEQEINKLEKQQAIKVMEKAAFSMTGQNKVWLAGNVLIRALLQNDWELTRKAQEIITSIDQRFSKGKVWLKDHKRFFHDNTGYIILQADTCIAITEEKEGQWKDFMGMYKPETLKSKMFSMYLSHCQSLGAW